MTETDIGIINLRNKYKDSNIKNTIKDCSEILGINQQSIIMNHDYLSYASVRQQPVSISLYLIDRIRNFCEEKSIGTLYIKNVETLPEYRRMGIAKNLISTSVNELLRTNGIKRIVAHTAGWKEDIVDGDKLLISLGFSNPEEENFIMGEDDDNFFKKYSMPVDKWVERWNNILEGEK